MAIKGDRQPLAERVMIIDHGRVIGDAPPERLKADLAGDRVRVRLAWNPLTYIG